MKFRILLGILIVSLSLPAFGRGESEKESAAETRKPAQAAEKSSIQDRPTQAGKPGQSQILTKAGISPLKQKTPISDFSLPTLSGETRSLSSYKGKVVLLNFWATWCPPCRAEMPSMEKLYASLKGKDFEILAVNLQEDPKTVRDFVTKNGYTFPILLDSDGRTGSVYGVRGIPTTYVIDKEGFVLGGTVGGKEWDGAEVVEAIGALLGNAD